MRPWTSSESEHLLRLVEHRCLPFRIVALKLGRTRAAVRAKYVALNQSPISGAGDPEENRPSVEAWRDRAERMGEPRSLTAWLQGDPPPSRSALAKKLTEGACP